jgi:hypothetical protein
VKGSSELRYRFPRKFGLRTGIDGAKNCGKIALSTLAVVERKHTVNFIEEVLTVDS